jgi:hypothetical protein
MIVIIWLISLSFWVFKLFLLSDMLLFGILVVCFLFTLFHLLILLNFLSYGNSLGFFLSRQIL